MNKKGCLIGFLIAFALIAGVIAFTVISEITRNPTVDGYGYTLLEDGTYRLERVIDAEIGKELTIPAEVKGKPVTAIESDVFKDNTTLEKVIIPSGVKKVSGFSGCTNLKEVKLSNSVEIIDYGAFENCTSLTKIELPTSVTQILYDAFKGCTALTEIYLPETLVEIGQGAFEGCTALRSVEWSASATFILPDVFKDCTDLSNIRIPEGVETLYGAAFDGCTSLTELTIPASVTDVTGSFYDCENLVKITYKGTMEQWKSIYGSQDVNGKCTVYCTDGNISDLD